MNTYRSGSPLSFTIDLIGDDGQPLSPVSVAYKVYDQNEVVKLASVNVADYVAGDGTVAITIASGINDLAVGVVRELRVIAITTTQADGSKGYINYKYLIESEFPLQPGINSYVTLSNAELIAATMSDFPSWQAADNAAKITALSEAYDRIGRLRFTFNRFNTIGGFDSTNGAFDNTVASFVNDIGNLNDIGMSDVIGLNRLSLTYFNSLPAAFLTALKKAQICEADVILGGDPIAQKRDDGLMSDSVGESSIMFRPGKPLSLPVNRKTLNYLAGFVTFSAKIGRR